MRNFIRISLEIFGLVLLLPVLAIFSPIIFFIIVVGLYLCEDDLKRSDDAK